MPVTLMPSTPAPSISTPAHILVVEDDPQLNQQMAELLAEAGYSVETCFDGASALVAASRRNHQLMILDLMLPKLDGISLLGMLRKTSQMPVIIVSAKGAEEERVIGLRQGADDYVSKPFNTTELLLRIEALMRRCQAKVDGDNKTMLLDSLLLNRGSMEASIEGDVLELTPTQFKILWELAVNHGRVLSKAYLSRQVLNRALGAYDRGLDMHLSRVRRKLQEAGWRSDRLQTVHGKGYCLS